MIEELSVDELRARAQRYVRIEVSDPERAKTLLLERLGVIRAERAGPREIRVFDGFDRVADMARVLVGDGLDLTALTIEEEDLEAHFMRLTGGEA